MLKKGTVIILLFCLCTLGVPGQNTDRYEIAWFSNFNAYRISDKLLGKTELHFRRIGLLDTWQQIMFRPQMHYLFNDQVSAGLGYSFFIHYPFNVPGVDQTGREHNSWEQINMKSKSGSFTFSNRFRFEQRFLTAYELAGETSVAKTEYANRFRYRLTVAVPILKNEEKKLSFKTYNEIFLNLRDNMMVHNFNQNWTSVGLSYAFGKNGSINAAYLYQWAGSGDSYNYTVFTGFSAGLNFKIDFRKKEDG